ncbi:hypothetical protein AB0A70_06670 [Streptomyces morookaense]|uniref:hypothetical protein n=1 Tax=Streptomyces TaxID=1883 RepID=UPI001D0F7B8B|nr:hypothetical protein [Streptomyces sp. ET3-23]MCC2278704.1 hypothetical protein [Streptomyces sp. ET3-23]
MSGALALSALLAGASVAQADDWGGAGSSSHAWNIRTKATASSDVIARIPANQDVRCWEHYCTGQVTGGSYTCPNSSQTYNTWTPLNYNGRKGWVADRCVGLGQM